MIVQRLGRGFEDAIRGLLLQDRLVNLFLLGFLDYQPIDRTHWYGVVVGSVVRGLVLIVPGRLVVPFAPDPEHAATLGALFRERFEPCMVVGPREASDALWEAWTGGQAAVDRFYDQRLYVLRDVPPGPPVPGFRRARLAEWRKLAVQAGRMEEEDLGRNPALLHPGMHERVVRDRVSAGRTWIIEREGQIVFQINVGTTIPEGCQVGGTYVPDAWRGQGWGAAGMRAVSAELLQSHPVVTLHVNEANTPAVRIYEKVGYVRTEPYRLITVR